MSKKMKLSDDLMDLVSGGAMQLDGEMLVSAEVVDGSILMTGEKGSQFRYTGLDSIQGAPGQQDMMLSAQTKALQGQIDCTSGPVATLPSDAYKKL